MTRGPLTLIAEIDNKCSCDEVTNKRCCSHRVKELVKSEPVDGEVWLLQPIDDATEGVEQSATQDESEDCNATLSIELRQIDECDPAKTDIERHIEPPRCIHPSHTEESGRDGSSPDDQEQESGLSGLQKKYCKRGIGTGNEKGDVRVIDASPQCFR